MKPTARPNPHKKLPRAKVMFGYPVQYAEGSCYVCNSKRKYAAQDLTFAVIPCHTPAQARAICRAAPFLMMTEGEKVERLGEAARHAVVPGFAAKISWRRSIDKESYRKIARACLRAMGLGGGK